VGTKSSKRGKKLFHYPNKENKTQVILCHTSRPILYYKNSLRYRLDGEYTKIPHYIIDKKGRVIKNFDEYYYSEFMGDEEIDKQSVIICLENLGWLNFNQLNNKYMNWIGDIYKGEVYQKRWRDRSFWSNYPDKQLKSCANLIVNLCDDLNVPLNLVGHNVKLDNALQFEGILTRSNYNEYWTDLSPSFNFEKLKTYIDEKKNI
jgi:N-acetyl-anhydromuramyl-L-alanine amidase AmpD